MFPILALALATSPVDYDSEIMVAIAIARAKRERIVVVTPPTPEPLPPNRRTVAPTGYPLRGNLWTGCPDWTHLTKGEHAGMFPVEWLKTLTNAEVQAVHSDAHEGRVKWEYVPKSSSVPTMGVQKVETPVTVLPMTTQKSTCPPGVNCPGNSQSTYRPGLLGRIFSR